MFGCVLLLLDLIHQNIDAFFGWLHQDSYLVRWFTHGPENKIVLLPGSIIQTWMDLQYIQIKIQSFDLQSVCRIFDIFLWIQGLMELRTLDLCNSLQSQFANHLTSYQPKHQGYILPVCFDRSTQTFYITVF